jgi:hypothetical protein
MQPKLTYIQTAPLTAVERFASKYIMRESGCWEWQQHLNRGYGVFTVHGKAKMAHRVMWELVGHKVDLSLELDHICNNRKCVNPKHLQEVTRQVNLLRSGSQSALNARKKTCPKGHPYTGRNLMVFRGKRHCRTCNTARKLEYNARVEAKAILKQLKEEI